MNNKHFNDEQDFINDDGFYHNTDSSEIPQEWLDDLADDYVRCEVFRPARRAAA